MKIKGFTLVETLIVIIMIGLLSMSMMTYLGGNDERVLRYKAE
ncbi:type II secretion system protein [bacterium]|nr:type II secretion system protein [bacterium]